MSNRILLLVLTYFLGSSLLLAQDKSRLNWYFGNGPVHHLRFGETTGEASFDREVQLNGFGRLGAAVATHSLTGDVLFFTNGLEVYDTYETLMQNGTLSSGTLLHNQSVAVSPVPGQDDLYYIFTKKPNGSLVYAVVDMTQAGNSAVAEHPLGDVILAEQTTGITGDEALLVVASPDLTAYWLLIQDAGTSIISVYQIQDYTTAGSALALSSNFDLNDEVSGTYEVSNFSYQRSRLALAPIQSSQNVLLFQFNAQNGVMNFERQVFGSGNLGPSSTDYAVYDTEFSEAADRLYLSVHGSSASAGSLWQVDLDSASANSPPREIQGPQWNLSYGLERGPDRNIYHLYQVPSTNVIRMGRVAEPDSAGMLSAYEVNPIETIDARAWQFPAFSPPRNLTPLIDFSTYNTCQNNPTQFFPIFDEDETPDSFSWDFGGQGSSQAQSPVFTFEEAGAIQVTLTVNWGAIEDSVSKTVNIREFDLQVQVQDANQRTVGGDTIVCPDDYPFDLTAIAQSEDSGGGGGGSGSTSNFYWSNQDGVAGATTTIDSAGVYWVATEGPNGCLAYGTVRVRTYGEERRTANVWYFGNEAGIDFNGDDGPTPLTDGQMNTPEGAATMSDENGQLLIYTDGVDIYDRTHNLMPNGTDIGGNNLSSQSVLIMAYPDDPTLYYIFTTDEVPGDRTYNMRYTVVDLKANGSLGDVAQGDDGLIKGVPLFDNSTERLTGLAGNGGGWMVGHEFGNNAFRTYTVSPDGVSSPVLTSAGSNHSYQNDQQAKGYMVISQSADKVAVPLAGSPPVLELFRFDTTGTLSDPITIELPDDNSLQPYGVFFSPGGSKVLVTMNGYENGGTGSMVVEYRVDSAVFFSEDAESRIQDSEQIALPYDAGLELGAMQQAPDGQIYLAINNSSFLGLVIPNEDTTANEVSTVDVMNGFDLAGKSSRMGLPNHIQNSGDQFDEPNWEVGETACVGDSTSFSATPSSDIDTYEWDFGDGNISTEQNPTHVYESEGTFTVRLKIMNRCLVEDANPEGIVMDSTRELTVMAIPPMPEFRVVGETELLQGVYGLCSGDSEQIEVLPDEPGLIYVWNTGDTARVITVDQPMTYEVTIYNEAGCSSENALDVLDGRPQVDLGPDQNLCTGDALQLDAGNPGASYLWTTLSGTILPDTTRVFSIDSVTAGETTYIVEVTSPAPFNCIARDTVLVRVNSRPDFAIGNVSDNTLNCSGPGDGSITLQGGGSGNYTFNWSNGATTQNLLDLNGGTYSVIITDNASGCQQRLDNILIQDQNAGFTIDEVLPDDMDCDGNPVLVTVTLSDDVFPVDYLVMMGSDTVDNQVNVANNGGNSFIIPALTTGNYGITVRASGNDCSQSEQFSVQMPDSLDVRAEYSKDGVNFIPVQGPVPACVGDELTLRGISDNLNAVMDWTNGASELLVNAPGTYTLTATDPTGELCGSTLQVEVSYDDFNITIEQEGTLCIDGADTTSVILRALPDPVPAGGASYRWYRVENNSLTEISGGVGQEIRVNSPGRYHVTVLSGDNGCVAEREIDVNGVEMKLHSLRDVYYLCSQNPSGAEVVLDPGDFDQYEWTLPNGENSTESALTVEELGVYRVRLTDGACTTTVRVEVQERCDPIVFIPNAFTPNSDGLNDDFQIQVTNFVEEFEIYIYNRWGQLIYVADNPDFKWDGTYKGKESPLGTYAWLIRYKNGLQPEAGQQEMRGGVVLLR